MVLQACLPPPRAWQLEGGIDTGSTPQGDDTADITIPCTSIAFMPDGSGEEGDARSHLTIFHDVLTEGSFVVDGSFTVDFYTWFTQEARSETHTLLSLGNDRAWWLKVEDGELVFQIKTEDAGADEFEIRVDYPDEEGWHHVALAYNADISPKAVSLYVDGTREGKETLDGPWPGPDPDTDVLKVARANDGSPSWPSSMDLLRFSQSLRYEGMTVVIEPETATEGWQGIWHFSGDTANALTGMESDAQDVRYSEGVCPL